MTEPTPVNITPDPYWVGRVKTLIRITEDPIITPAERARVMDKAHLFATLALADATDRQTDVLFNEIERLAQNVRNFDNNLHANMNRERP